MGMFDTVEVHRKLPLKANGEVTSKDVTALNKKFSWKEIEFQTKSLDNCMEHFKIGVNGKLYVKRQKYKEPDPKNRQGKKGKNLFDNFPLLEPDGKPWFEPAPKIPTSLQFYTNVELNKGKEYWLEFEAIFLEGKLHQIKQIILEEIKLTELDFSGCTDIETKYNQDDLYHYQKPLRKFFKKFIKWQEKILLGKK